MGKEMISEQVTTRNGQRGFVGPDGKWYPIAGQTPATPNFGERLPGESTADFHKRLRGNLPPAKPKPAPKPEATKVEPKPEAKPEAKAEAKPEAPKVEPTKGPKLVWNKERMDFDGPETTATPTPKPEPAKVEPTPTSAPKPEGVSAGLKKWASIYGPGGPKQLKQFTPSQRRLFRYTHPSTEKPMEAYDVVLDYLLSEGHAETLEEAHYVMMQLDSEYVQEVIQERAWWDPAGLFTKTDKEKALEKGGPGYDKNRGTSNRGGDNQRVIVAPLTTGGVTRYVTQKPGDPTKDPSIAASRDPATHPSWKSDIARLKAVAPDVISKSTQVAQGQQQLARDEAEARARASKLPPGDAAREPLAPRPKSAPVVAKSAPVVAKPKPKPVVVAKAQPTPTPAVAKRPSILSDVDDLKRMRAASLMRQQGKRLPSGKIPVGSDLKPKP